MIFSTISSFIFHFINFNYSLRKSKEVVLLFCKRYELDQSRTHQLLSELESAQNQINLELKKEEIIQISKNKKKKRHKKSNGKSNLLILMLAVKFIGTNPSQ